MINSTSANGRTPDAPTRAELNASVAKLEALLHLLGSLETEHDAALLEQIAQLESARDFCLSGLADHDELERLDRESAERAAEQAADGFTRQQIEADLALVDEALGKLKSGPVGADHAARLAMIGQYEKARAAIVAQLDAVAFADEFKNLSPEELQSKSLSVEIDDVVAVVRERGEQLTAGLAPTLAAIARASRRALFLARATRPMTRTAPALCDRDAVRRRNVAHQTAGPPPPLPRALTSHAFEAVAA